MKKQYLYATLIVLVISLVILSACSPAATPEPAAEVKPTEVDALKTEESAEANKAPDNLGTPENPIILAFAPSMTSQQILESGAPLAAKLEELSGYTFKTNLPTSYAALIEAMGSGNAHISLFPTFAYLVAHDKGYANVGLIVERYGSTSYGAQFIAKKSSGFTSYFDETKKENTADDKTALAQFDGKKPCWTDPLSTSGYIVPFGILSKSGITTKPGAFVQGHPTVVTALNAGGICDFGVTFIDVRTNKDVQASIPNVMEEIQVIWRTDKIIPNDNISFAANLKPEMVQKIKEAFLELSSTDEGKEILKAIYEFEKVQEADDTFYDDFRVYLQAAGFDYTTQVK